jgi:hypothetical protein
MKRLLAGLILSTAVLVLSGCYIDPGYSYVRPGGYQGDVYYGRGVTTYDDGYYAVPAYGGYYPGYYGYGYGCCYAPGVSLGIGSVWYGGSYYRGGRGYRGHGHGYRDGRQWQGQQRSGGRTQWREQQRSGGRTHGNRRDGGRRSGDRADRRDDR